MTVVQEAFAQTERLIQAVKDQTKVMERVAVAVEAIERRTPDPFDGIELDDIDPEPEDDNALGRQGGCSDL